MAIVFAGSRILFRFNIFITFPISGLWHGASLGYVIWGILNGLFMVVGKATAKKRRKWAKKNPLYKVPHLQGIWQRCCVYLLFTACIVFFAADLYGGQAGAVFTGLFAGWGQAGPAQLAAGFAKLGLGGGTLLMLLGSSLVVELIEARGPVAQWIRTQRAFVRWPLYYGLCLLLLFFGAFGQSAYIYQQF